MRSWVVCAAVLASGCNLSVSLSVATPTALERQLLGEYEELDRDLIYASSVRGAPHPDSLAGAKARAVQARAIQRFNADDLSELAQAGCVAETLRGEVVARPCSFTGDESAEKRLERVVREENSSRKEILAWAAFSAARAGGRAEATPEEIEELRRMYARLLRESARPKALFEVEPGSFQELRR